MRRLLAVCAFVWLVVPGTQAAAQSNDRPFQAGVQVVTATSGQFDTTEVGIGGRFSWNVTPFIGADAEVNVFPGDFEVGRGAAALSEARLEGLFGVTMGPVLGRVRPFGKVRPGFVTFQEAPRPFACILIFPPPLACQLAAGDTLFALDLGGGVEVIPSDRTIIRLDFGDRLVRYAGPAIDADREVHEDAFFGHDFRFSVGGGVRF